MENLLEIISEISTYFIKLEILQNEYDNLLQKYITERKQEAAKKNWKQRQNVQKPKSTAKFTFTKTKNNTNRSTTHKPNNNMNNSNLNNKPPQTEKAKQYQKRIEEERNDKRWDTYTFFEPHKDKQKLEKKTLQRLKPKITLCKILKKIYHRLLLKLHPDRSSLENSEKVCKRLVKCYKSADYFYLFHLFKVINCKIYLSKVECDMLSPFLNQEIQRIRITLKILQENIYKFKNYKE